MATAIMIGAGASRAVGYPLTNELLPRIHSKAADRTLFDTSPEGVREAEAVEAFLKRLFPRIGETDVGYPPITSVLSLIDYSILSNAPLFSPATIDDVRRERRRLESGLLTVIAPDEKMVNRKAMLMAFATWLREIKKNDTVGVISTNYDIALETELYRDLKFDHDLIAASFDFGFNWRDPGDGSVRQRPVTPAIRWLKLHGSVDWLRCDVCQHIYINPGDTIARLGYLNEIADYNTCHCRQAPLSAVLVAPSTVRDIRDPNLLIIWQNALELLRTSDQWIIIGYSFPDEDIAIRSVFMRAYAARAAHGAAPNVKVIQKDETSRSRFRLLFPDCDYDSRGLEQMLTISN